jgi:hypothetical protein
MIFGYLMLVIAITISAIAAWYSVAGLTAIFSAAVIPVIIMGGSLEAGKIVATVWLHNNWKRASWAYKTYLVPAIVALMLLTSMGIFGFLSKGHADQNIVSGDAMSKVAIFDEKIATEKENIAQAKKALEQMNAQVDQMLGRTDTDRGAERAVTIRKQQARERAALNAEITRSQKTIQQLQQERAPLAAEFRKVEAEVGPIKYIAALIYGDNPDQNLLEAAVRWVIILIVIVFDPLALCLILAANKQLEWARAGRGGWVHDEEEQTAPAVAATDGATAESPPQTTYEADDGPLTAKQLDQIQNLARAPVCPKCQTVLLDAAGIGPFCPNKECDVVDGINLYTNTAGSPEEFFEQAREIAQRLDAETTQLVEPEDELSQEEIEQIRIDEINRELAAIEPTEEPVVEVVDESELHVISAEERALALLDSAEEIIQELSNEVTTKNAHIANIEADYVQLQNNSIHWIQEQQDLYRQLEEVEATRNVEKQRANNLQAQLDELLAEKNLKEATLTQNIAADNSYQLKKSPSSSFGIEFPANPGKGDLFLRTDFLPTKLFKFNGLIWIETDKNKTDTYTYNDQYVEFLIEKLRTGEYSAEDINDAEHEQIAQYLQDKNGKSS